MLVFLFKVVKNLYEPRHNANIGLVEKTKRDSGFCGQNLLCIYSQINVDFNNDIYIYTDFKRTMK